MCQILRLKRIKFNFRWGSAPDPAGGAYSSPDPLAVFRGLLLRTGKEREGNEREGREGQGGEWPYAPLVANFWLRHWLMFESFIGHVCRTVC